jgi:hypothetical protein
MSADRAFKQTQNSTKPRERAATRVAAVLLGVFFVIGCPTAVLMHASLRIELEATIYKAIIFASISLVGAAVGVVFIFVGIAGYAPTWFQNCAKQR